MIFYVTVHMRQQEIFFFYSYINFEGNVQCVTLKAMSITKVEGFWR